jgi:hypothetical protein
MDNMNTYLVLSNMNNMFYYYQKCILLLLKNSKVHIHIVQITNSILNEILSNFMINKKVKHKNVVRGKNDICSPTLTIGWLIRMWQWDRPGGSARAGAACTIACHWGRWAVVTRRLVIGPFKLKFDHSNMNSTVWTEN